MATAIRALQFEDMASQLIDCVNKRLLRLANVVERLGQLGQQGHANLESLVEEVHGHARSIRDDYAVEIGSPVVQTSMSVGSVELF